MPEFFENNEMEERVILVGVSSQDGDDTEDSLDELEELVKTAGAVTVGRVIQNRQTIHPGLYIGSGKVEELLDEIAWTNATGIVCDDELSPAQLRNLSDALNVKVMDRTLIILDIFAARASTSEGKIQVELAQLRYRMSRLSGIGKSMSRLGGGIGTKRSGREKDRGRPSCDCIKNQPAQTGVRGSEKAREVNSCGKTAESCSGGSDCRVYQCR